MSPCLKFGILHFFLWRGLTPMYLEEDVLYVGGEPNSTRIHRGHQGVATGMVPTSHCLKLEGD